MATHDTPQTHTRPLCASKNTLTIRLYHVQQHNCTTHAKKNTCTTHKYTIVPRKKTPISRTQTQHVHT